MWKPRTYLYASAIFYALLALATALTLPPTPCTLAQDKAPVHGGSEVEQTETEAAAALAMDGDGFLAEVRKAEQELLDKQRPDAGLYGNVFTDKNKVTVLHGGIFSHVTVFESLKLALQAMSGALHQESDGTRPESNIQRTSVEFGLNDFFVTPHFVIWGAALYEHFDMDEHPGPRYDSKGFFISERKDLERGYLLGGTLGAKYFFPNESELGIEGKRESIWKEHNTYDARLFNRVYDMSRMSADMAINKLHVFSDVVTFPEHKWRTDLGAEDFEDGNARLWAYTHYQIPVLWSRNKHWTVIRPNAYVEHMDKYSDAYFSPDHHISVGTMLHTIQEFDYMDIEAEVNPQLLWTKDKTQDGSTAAGVHGLLRLTFKPTDSMRLGIGGFGYADTDEYWLLRANAFIRFIF